MLFILDVFAPQYERYTPYSRTGYIRRVVIGEHRGRPRSMKATQCLGLTLAWYRTRGSSMVLSALYGITGSVCSTFLRFGRRIILRAVSRTAEAAVQMPSVEEVRAFQRAISSKYSLLPDVYSVADGLKLYLQQSRNAMIQNIIYNGWKHDHHISNVLVFATSGLVIACAFNAPGSMHDLSIAEWGSIYTKLEPMFHQTGGICMVDWALCRKQYPFLVKSAQDLPDTADPATLHRSQQATSARQGSEWGMRAFKSSFLRLKDRLVYEERGERRLILHLVVFLFNVRTGLVDMNQILTSFMPHLSVEANIFLP